MIKSRSHHEWLRSHSSHRRDEEFLLFIGVRLIIIFCWQISLIYFKDQMTLTEFLHFKMRKLYPVNCFVKDVAFFPIASGLSSGMQPWTVWSLNGPLNYITHVFHSKLLLTRRTNKDSRRLKQTSPYCPVGRCGKH